MRRCLASYSLPFERLVFVVATLATFCVTTGVTTSAHAQILYNTLGSNGELLRQVNPDGSGNSPIQIGNLPQEANPAVSNDGRFLSVRSQDPGRPSQFSSNVWVLDSADGSLQKITDFEDSTDTGGNTFNHSPRYTAFSPDGSLIAISSFLNTQTPSSGGMTTAFTYVHRVSDGAMIDGPTINGTASTLSTLGTGISWSSSSNRVAIPTNAQNGATAIFSGNSLANIPVRQETFPQFGTLQNGNFVEEDSFPAYSPNGQALAYFRSRDILTISGAQPSQLSLRIKSNAGDRSIFNFNPGFQPTGISWSPDGSQLAIGVGQQVFGGGSYFNLADPNTAEVLTINVNGSGISQLVGAPAFSPAWSSLGAGGSAEDLNNDGFVDGLDLGILLGNFNQNTSPSGGELNGTNPVDGLDLGILLGAWNPPPTLSAIAVPEPSSASLAFAMVALGVFYPRQR